VEDGYVAVSLMCAHLPIVICRAVAVSETGEVGEVGEVVAAVADLVREVVGLLIVGLLIVEDVEDVEVLGAVLFEEPLTEET
jgi:hypothetical protein